MERDIRVDPVGIGLRLQDSFYAADTGKVARDILGCVLRHETPDGIVSGIIVETEAYRGIGDEASHARKGPTKRCRIMFGLPGKAYVYLIYGVHSMFNIVTEGDGTAGAILLRALEPLEGAEIMAKRRGVTDPRLLTNGPARLTQALGIGLEHNGVDLTEGPLGVWEKNAKRAFGIISTPRIGVTGSKIEPWRFIVNGNKYVSA